MRPARSAFASALLACALVTAVASAEEPVDNCATMLGSLAVELRFAHALPPGRHTTFVCPKRFQPLLGASRQRILRALGTPDLSSADQGWSYFFAGSRSEREPGTPELVFSFDELQQVNAIECRRTR